MHGAELGGEKQSISSSQDVILTIDFPSFVLNEIKQWKEKDHKSSDPECVQYQTF